MDASLTADSAAGLTEEQVRERLEQDGYNELPSSKRRSSFALALGVVREPMFLLLIVSAMI